MTEPSGITPRRDKVAATLARWCQEAQAGERRTVVLRTEFSAAPEAMERELGHLGAQVESIGPGAIVIVVSATVLRAVAELSWVRAVEEPRTLQARFPAH